MHAQQMARCGVALAAATTLVGLSLIHAPAIRPLAARPARHAPALVEVAPLARYFPRQDLVAFLEFDGLDHHSAAWTQTAAYSILVDTPTGQMLRTLMARLLDEALARPAPSNLKGDELVALLEQMLRSGFAAGIVRASAEPKPAVLGLVIRGGGGPDMRATMLKILGMPRRGREAAAVEDRAGRRLNFRPGPGGRVLAWWFDGDDLLLSLTGAGGADAMIGARDERVPSAATLPLRQGLARRDGAFTPIGWAFFDRDALPPLPPRAVALGLDQIERLEYQWGVEDDAIKTVTRLVVPEPRTGMLNALDQPGFGLADLPALPRGLSGFSALSFEPDAFLERLLEIEAAGRGPSRLAERVADIAENIREATGRDLHRDVLQPVGPTWTFYQLPTTGRVPTNPLGGFLGGLVRTPRMVLVADVREGAAFADVLDALMPEFNKDLERWSPRFPFGVSEEVAPPRFGVVEGPLAVPADVPKAEMKAAMPAEPPPPPVPPGTEPLLPHLLMTPGPGQEPDEGAEAARGPRFRKLPPPERGWTLSEPIAVFPLPVGMRPTVLVGRRHMAIATTLDAARTALAREDEPGGLTVGDPLAASLEGLPERMVWLHVSDPRNGLLPDVLANLPSLIDMLRGNALGGSPMRNFPPLRRILGDSSTAPRARLGRAFAPEDLPTPEAIRRHLFPGTYTLVADAEGFRFETREAFPTLNPASLVPLALAAAVPWLSASQETAERARSANNLKQIGLAFHNFADAHGRFPADIRGPDGTPLLSWRVELLPFLEQQPLFDAIRKDEPWDSPHNRALLEHMPPVFAIQGAEDPGPGQTFYTGFTGPHTVFEKRAGRPLTFAEVPDGTSNTIAVVEAREAVLWTRPDSDIPFTLDATRLQREAVKPRVGGQWPGGFHALMLDGSVRFLRDSISEQILQALVTRDGGEVVSQDDRQ
jgi:hypothetical protein